MPSPNQNGVVVELDFPSFISSFINRRTAQPRKSIGTTLTSKEAPGRATEVFPRYERFTYGFRELCFVEIPYLTLF